LSFHYGSDSPEIKNPFKQEGLVYLINGLLILFIGILSIVTLRGQIVKSGLATGWFSLTISLILLTLGIHLIAQGWLRRSRFYVGRGVPTSLSKNISRSEIDTSESEVYYDSGQIEQMLMGRKNITFIEPVTLFDRIIYSLYPNLIFLPYSMRNFLHIMVKNTGYSLIAFLVYIIAVLSGTIGLTLLTQSSFSDWLGIALCLFLIVTWLGSPISLKEANQKSLTQGKNSQIAWVIALAVLVPAIGELLLRQGINIPQSPFNPLLALIIFFALISLAFITGLTLAKLRADLANPTTEVSEFKDHWQENIHPQDFFRSLDMELANIRYREIPNRVYRELNPSLHMEGSMDKGNFDGDTIQETQPIFENISYPDLLRKFRFYITIIGHSLVTLTAFLLFFNQGAIELNVNSLFLALFYPGVLWLFGTVILKSVHLYWGEMQFKSYLIQFRGEGTYTESKLSVGMAITDSTRSENTIVRTSYSPWLLLSQIVSSTQVKPGANSFSHARSLALH